MSILDAHAEGLRTTALNAVPVPGAQPEPGIFDNFGSGAGRYFMRSMAEAGRALSMAGAAIPVAADKLAGLKPDDDRSIAASYFRWHDQTFGAAVDYWTPKPQEVGAAGQVVGQLAGGLVQFLANPALLVGTAQLSTAEDLVRKGVDADAAILAGDVAGLATVAGIALPIFGRNLVQRVAAGAAGNLATSIPEAALKGEIVKAAGASKEVQHEFDPWDARARFVDVLLGAAFGAKAHVDARAAGQMTATQRDAIATMAAARHLEEASAPTRPATEADLTANVQKTRQAIEQMLRGEPVHVDGEMTPMRPEDLPPERVELARLIEDELRPMSGEPIERPDITAGRPPPEGEPRAGDAPEGMRARDLQAEMVAGRKETAVLAKLLECLG